MSFMTSSARRFSASWTVVPFDQAVSDMTGGNPKIHTSDYQTRGRLRVIDQGQTAIAGYVDDISLACKAPLPCVLFGDHTRIFKYVDAPFALGADGVKVLVPRPGLNARFLFHYLKTVRLPDDLGYSRHFKYLRETSVPIPDPEEQRRIADVLDKADAIRRKRKAAIALTDDLLRSTFLDMFGDPATNPKGWPMRSVSDLCASKQYGTAEKANSERRGLPVLRMGNIAYWGGIDLTDMKWVELSPTETQKLDLRDGDLLFNRVNSLELVGKTAVWHGGPGYTFAGYLIRLRLVEHVANGDYVAAAMNTSSIKRRLIALAKPSVNMANISGSDLDRLHLPIPPLPLQESYARVAGGVLRNQTRYSAAHQTAYALVGALVAECFPSADFAEDGSR